MDAKNLAQEVTRLHADICSALADPTRILLLYALSERAHTVNELSDALTSVPTGDLAPPEDPARARTGEHATRHAQSIEYALNDTRIIDALDTLRAVLRDSLARRAQLISE